MRIRRPLLLAAVLLQVGAAAEASPEAAISGRVLDSAAAPVAGARVIALPHRSPERELLDRTKGVEPSPAEETKTDARGAFRLAAPKAGDEVSIRILAPGLPSIDIDRPFDGSTGEGEIEVSIPPGKRISGRITDDLGRPVAGASLRAQAPLELTEGGLGFEETRSGPDGSFSLAAAPEGDLSVRVAAPGYAPVSRSGGSATPLKVILRQGGSVEGVVKNRSGKPVEAAIVVVGDRAASSDEAGRFRIDDVAEGIANVRASKGEDLIAQRAVRVRRGATARADITLATSAAIAGVVVDEKTRKPLARARVQAFDVPFPDPGSRCVRESRTDSRGRYRLAGLFVRSYRISISQPGYLSASVSCGATAPSAATLRIALERAATITGRVLDEESRGISGVQVGMLPGQSRRAIRHNDPARPLPSVLTSESGAFRLAALPGGITAIRATREGFVPVRRDGLTAAEVAGKPITIVLRRGLEARGRVVDEDGQAVSGASVTVTQIEERVHRFAAVIVSSAGEMTGSEPRATSSADGSFAIKALEAGRYGATIRHPLYAAKTVPSLEVKASGATRWDPFVLAPAVRVAGVVRNREGQPIVGASVDGYGGDESRQAQTDSAGGFELEGYGDGASLTIVARAAGYAAGRQKVKAPAPSIAFVLVPAASIRGRVEDAESKQPIESFSVQLRSRGSYEEDRRDFRAEDGLFELSEIPPGQAELTVSAAGYLDGKATGIDVAEGETREGVVISLHRGRAVSGRVLDASRGTGVPNATVSWRRSSDRGDSGVAYGPGGAFLMVQNGVTSDADGHFQYDSLPAEKLIFKASHPDFQDAEKSVDASAESSVDLPMSQGGSIAGTVVGRDGRSPVPGAEVNLLESGAGASSWTGDETNADDSGGFSFQHLKEGRYQLTVRASNGTAPVREVILSPGQSAEGVVLQLSSGATLRGQVTGLPVEKLGGLQISANGESFGASIVTGADGSFVMTDVPAGIIRVTASPTTWMNGRAVSKNVEVAADASEVSVELKFQGGSRLEVHVTRKDQPVPNLAVHAGPDPLFSPGLEAFGSTDANGHCVLEELADGGYLLRGVGPGVYFTRKVAVSGDTSVDVAMGAASVSGTVTDASTGEPLADVGVSAETGQETSRFQVRSARTDTSGYYVIDELDAVSLQVTARRDGYRQKTLPLSVGDGPGELSFALSRGGGLALRALDGLSGLALSGLTVLAYSDTGAIAFSGSVALDATGTGEVASLAAGTYSLYVFSDGYAPQVLAAVPVPSAPITLSLTPGGRFEVRSGAAAVGRILNAAGMVYLASPWRLDGRQAIAPPVTAWDHLAPGSYRLVVEGPEGEKSFPFAMAEGQTTRLELQ